MRKLLLFFLAFAVFQLHAAVNDKQIIEAHDFPTEEYFSRQLKSDYDFIQKRWISIDEKSIKLEVYNLGNISIPSEFTFTGPREKTLINKDNIKYFNYGAPIAFVAYGALFWDWGKGSGFNFKDEGWFGHDTYAGGVDKLSHMHSHYVITRASYYFYRHSGLSHEEALKSSFILSTALGVFVEIGDGFTHYGFSINDFIANMVGIALGHLLNSNAYLDELIGFQLRWWHDGGSSGESLDPLADYNNEKFLLNFRMAAVPKLRDFNVTKYFNLDLGYYARGFKTEEVNPAKIRTVFVGASINMGQLIHDFWPKSDFSYGAAAVTRYYQLPYTSVELQTWDKTN
jgi:hypothetical protein